MSEFISYKNSNIHYTDQGKGSVVVLLHGFLENLSMWQKIAPQLAKTHRVICVDLLGHGQTECIAETHNMETMANAVKAVLDHLLVTTVTLVGHSMGGYVGLAFAETNPQMVEALCLMNSTTTNDSKERKNNRDRAIEAVQQNYKTFIRLSIPNLFAEYNRHRFKKDIEDNIQQALTMSPNGIIAALKGMKERKDRTSFYRSATFKKLMIIGREDPILDYDQLKSQTKNSDINVVELDGGHMSHIENYEVFSYNILHFIENL